MAKKQVKWRVSPAPTGQFRSFQRRQWPMGYSNDQNETTLFSILCADEYTPARAAGTEAHKPLSVAVAVRNDRECGFGWRTLRDSFDTLAAAKTAAERFYAERPHVFINKDKDDE